MEFDFLIPRRPLSLQAKPAKLAQWKTFVHAQVTADWTGPEFHEPVSVTLVYLAGESPPDIDNIVKPILDAMKGLVFADDALVADVDSHRRFLADSFDLTQLPDKLITAIHAGTESVYVRIRESRPLEAYL